MMDEVRREGRVNPETLAVLHRSETELDEMGAGAGGGGGVRYTNPPGRD